MKQTLLERVPFFSGLDPAKLEALLAQPPARAPKGTVLFRPGQPCRGFPLLLEGTVRVSQTSPGGREIVLYHVEPGEGCLLSGGCLLGHSDYAAAGVAETDVTLLSIPDIRVGDPVTRIERTDDGVTVNAIVRFDPRTEKLDVWKLPEDTGYANLNTGAFDRDGVHWFTGQNGIYGKVDPGGEVRLSPGRRRPRPAGCARCGTCRPARR